MIYLTNLQTDCCHVRKIISNMLCHVCVLKKVEDRVASDQELKLTELLRYYTRDIQAAKVKLFLSCIFYGLYNSTKHIRLYFL